MLRIYLTGELCVTTDAGVVRASRLPGRQGRLLFAYLVDHRADPVTRDEIADLLWPRSLPPSYELALSALVSKLRAVLKEEAAIVADSGCYQLVFDSPVWVDVDAAFEAVHLAEGALAIDDPAAGYGHAVVACSILGRPFLPGAEGIWVDRRRDELQTARLRALDCLAVIHSWNGEHPLALQAANEAVELEPYRESGYRRLMALHGQAGNPGEAIRVYERLLALLAKELQTAPTEATQEVLRAVAPASALAKMAEK